MRSPQGSQMGAASKPLSQIVCEAPNVSSRRTSHAKLHERQVQCRDLEFVDFHWHWRSLDQPAFASQLIGSNAADFLCGKWRRHLVDLAGKGVYGFFDLCCGAFDGNVARWSECPHDRRCLSRIRIGSLRCTLSASSECIDRCAWPFRHKLVKHPWPSGRACQGGQPSKLKTSRGWSRQRHATSCLPACR